MQNVRLADGDGDGHLDLYSYRADAARMNDAGGKLDAVRGMPTEAWRRLGGKWIGGADFNDDGDADLLCRPMSIGKGAELLAICGRKGHTLWHAKVHGVTPNAGAVGLAVALLSLGVFCVSAWTASEFAIVQRIVPRAQVANGIGLYNGLTTMIGGGLGPFVVGGIIDGGANTGDLVTIFGLCVAVAVLLIAFSRQVRY